MIIFFSLDYWSHVMPAAEHSEDSFMMPGLSSPRREAELFWWTGWGAKLPWKERSQRKCVCMGFLSYSSMNYNANCLIIYSAGLAPAWSLHPAKENMSRCLVALPVTAQRETVSHYHRDLKKGKTRGSWLAAPVTSVQALHSSLLITKLSIHKKAAGQGSHISHSKFFLPFYVLKSPWAIIP